jgi:hypothetical protein
MTHTDQYIRQEIENIAFDPIDTINGIKGETFIGLAFDTLLTTNEIIIPDFKIYPNPSKEEMNIIFENLQKDGLIEIFDISGQLLFSKSVQRESKTTSLDATHLSTGVYLVKFSGQEIKSLTKKWIKL